MYERHNIYIYIYIYRYIIYIYIHTYTHTHTHTHTHTKGDTKRTKREAKSSPFGVPTHPSPPQQVEALFNRLEALEVDVGKDIEEKFIRGSGAGGQKVNKTSNNVQLIHLREIKLK
jgi:protein subunit release factor B